MVSEAWTSIYYAGTYIELRSKTYVDFNEWLLLIVFAIYFKILSKFTV